MNVTNSVIACLFRHVSDTVSYRSSLGSDFSVIQYYVQSGLTQMNILKGGGKVSHGQH